MATSRASAAQIFPGKGLGFLSTSTLPLSGILCEVETDCLDSPWHVAPQCPHPS